MRSITLIWSVLTGLEAPYARMNDALLWYRKMKQTLWSYLANRRNVEIRKERNGCNTAN
jgi:hypothetical protein